jgi:pyrroline-5-carboxylate reductase
MVGFIGSGNIARAIARGWGEPVLCTDGGSGRAAGLVAELGGEVAPGNAELAARAELVVLCHKPAQLEEVAAELRDAPPVPVLSVLGRRTLAEVRAAHPSRPVARAMPNTPVEVRRGVTCLATGSDELPGLAERLARLGTVVPLPERLMDLATGTSGAAPALLAVVAEALVDGAVKHGMPRATALALTLEGMAGTAELLRARGGDTLQVRVEVTSPGGTTARGLAALERAGVRAGLIAAVDDMAA